MKSQKEKQQLAQKAIAEVCDNYRSFLSDKDNLERQKSLLISVMNEKGIVAIAEKIIDRLTGSRSELIEYFIEDMKVFLLEKNISYGNSAFDPKRIFSTSDPKEQILVRIDDKLSRMIDGNSYGEDTIKDLAGYFLIYKAYDLYHAYVNEESEVTVP